MAGVQGDYGNPIHGVSQQPDSRKFKGQYREGVNVRNDVLSGLSDRVGFTYIGKLGGIELDNAKWHLSERGDDKDFLFALCSDEPRIFDTNAIKKPFTFLNNSDVYYQNSLTEPEKQIGANSVLDTTFITNRNVIPEGEKDSDDIETPPSVIWIEFGTFQSGSEIQIDIDSETSYLYDVFDGYVTVDIDDNVQSPSDEGERTREYSGSYHANVFTNGEPDTPVGGTGLDTTPRIGRSYNNWVRLVPEDFTTPPETENGVSILKGTSSLTLYFNNDLDDVSLLPPVACDGDVCRVVQGQGQDSNKGYFVARRKNTEGGSDSSFGEVTWEETSAVGSDGSFNKQTMPQVIRRDSSDNFTMDNFGWFSRSTGDYETNPYPSFITNSTVIQSVGLFQNRLFLTSGESVMFSATNTYEDLWLESAFYLTDSDPFESIANTEELNILKFTEQFDGDLVLFSENGQFLMYGDKIQTYSDNSITSASRFKSDLNSDPVLSGNSIYFATNYGNYAGVRQFFTDNVTATKNSLPITAQIEKYIGGSIYQMASSTNQDVLCCLSEEDKSKIYLYEWKYQGNEKVQSAWCHWELHDGLEVVYIVFIKSVLYSVVKDINEGTYHLWNLEWDNPPELYELPFSISLDGKFKSETTYNKDLNRTEVVTPYPFYDIVFIKDINSEAAGFEFSMEQDEDDISVWFKEGDWTESVSGVIGGIPYDVSVTFSQPSIRDQQGVSMGLSRLQLGTMDFTFSRVGSVNFMVTDVEGEVLRSNTFSNRRLNNKNNKVSYVPTEDSFYSVKVRRDSTRALVKIAKRDYTPFTIISIEWTGEINPKRRRVY